MTRASVQLALLLTLAAALAGCPKGTDSSQYTLDSLIKKGFGGGDGRTPVEQAAAAFDQSDPDIRRGAIEALSQKKWALRDPYLKRFAALTNPDQEPDPSVRAVSVRALGRAGDTKYLPEIIAALDDPAAVVRWDAATVLVSMPDDKAVPSLQKLVISDESVDVRATSAKALRNYRTDSVFRTLLRALDDEDFTVRNAAHEALVFQTDTDMGYDPMNWLTEGEKLGAETLPEPTVRYRKRPWWDWMKVTGETENIQPAKSNETHWWDASSGSKTVPEETKTEEPEKQ